MIEALVCGFCMSLVSGGKFIHGNQIECTNKECGAIWRDGELLVPSKLAGS